MKTLAPILLAGVAVLLAQTAPRAVSTDALIGDLERRIKTSPADTGLRDRLAGAFLQKMRETADGAYLERATKLVHAVLEVEPANYAARRREIEIEMQWHRFQLVVAQTKTLSRERPDDSLVWALRGDALMELGDYDSAEGSYQKMIDLRPGMASYSRIAFFRFVTGDAEGAIQSMRQSVRAGTGPENVAWCLSDLGNMLFKTGAEAEAESAYRQALALFPGYHHALFGLARVLAARGEAGQAVESLLQAQARAPFPEYAGLLAKLYRKSGRNDLAEKQIALLDVYDKLGRAAGEFANRNLSLAFADLGHRTDRALELARAELNVRHDVYTYDALAWAQFRNGGAVEAAETIAKALAQHSPEPLFHEHAAGIFEAVGRAELAAEHRERARALNPHYEIR